MLNPYLDAAFLVFWYQFAWFLAAVFKKDNSVADIGWGLGFVLVFWWQFVFYGQHVLLGAMVTLWGARLAVHIFMRNRKKGEDWRYRKWREEWGKNFLLRSFFQVFMLQGLLMWVIALPLVQTVPQARPTAVWAVVPAVVLWLFGFLWEAIADWQLSRFKSDPSNKGKVFTGGLWRFSRHPNYFGEILVWWGIFLFVLPYGVWWLCLLSPITVTWLLNRVSGVPMLEEKYSGNPEYQAYVDQTNSLIPGPGKSN